MDWFRSWHGAPTDTKWLVIAKRANVAPGMVSAIAWALFDCASQATDRGSVAGFDVEMYAVYSGFSEDDIAAVLTAMRDKEIIDAAGRIAAWEKRQPKREDDSAERVARYREKQRDVTQCDAPVTQDDAPVTQSNADVTQGNAPEQIQNRTEQNRAEQSREEGAPSAPPPAPLPPTPPERIVIDLTNEPPSLMSLYRDASGEMGQITPAFRTWFSQITSRYTRPQCEAVFRQLSADIVAGKTNGSKWTHTVALFEALNASAKPEKSNGHSLTAARHPAYDPGSDADLAALRAFKAADEAARLTASSTG